MARTAHPNGLVRVWLANEIQRMGFFLADRGCIPTVATVATFARLRMNTLAEQGWNLFIRLLVAGRAFIPGRCCCLGVFLVPAGLSYVRSDGGRCEPLLVSFCPAERANEPDDRGNLRVIESSDPKRHRLPAPLDDL